MKNLILTIIITLPLTLWGQVWEQTFGGEGYDLGRSVQQTTNGGYIITGWTWSFGNGGRDVYLIKTDESGNEQWSNTFGGEGGDKGYSVQQTSDGGYIITGKGSFGDIGDTIFEVGVYLIKTDENGNEQWSQTFGGGENDDQGHSVQQTSDGGFIICGVKDFNTDFNSDVYLIKTDENGNEQWTQTFGGGVSEWGYSVQQTTDGGYIITGDTYSFGNGQRDVYLIKTDENGNEQWTQTFGGDNLDYGYSVQQTTDGGYIITGNTQSFGNGNYDVYLIKTDGYGNILPYESTLNGCDSIQSLINETYFSESGIYTDTLTNVFGGDSVIVQEIEIFNSPENIVIEGNTDAFSSTLESYQITINPNNSIEWNVEGETISESDGNTIQVLWGDEGIGYVEITETDTNGCSTTSTLEVTISNEPTNIYEYNTTRKLIKTINLLGQEIKPQKNQSYIEIYDDGTRKRKIIIE